jgi:nondiscriminating aspartyl-tRNA synthetase
MQRILSMHLPAHVGEKVRLAGWLHRRRQLKSVAFLILRDRTGLAQAVITEPLMRGEFSSLTEESVIEVEGVVVANAVAPGGVELDTAQIRVVSPAQPVPLELYRPTLRAGLSGRLDHAAAALRHPQRAQTARISAAVTRGFRQALDGLGFVEVHTPKIVASATESGANVFGIEYFGRGAFLAQSPQFYKQTMVGALERVYEVGPAFRAEPHDTVRHLAQYTSLDAELGFITDHRDVMAVVRDTVAGMLEAAAEQGGPTAAASGFAAQTVPQVIPELHFATAMRMLSEAFGEDLTDEPDLAPAHERWLGDWALREHGSAWLFVVGYPMAKRPFYTHPDPHQSEYSNSFDLLFRGLEVVTGGQRLHRYADYVAALAARAESAEPYERYLDAFRWGMPPHGGFAIGAERFVARLLDLTNVREVALFPRDLHRLTP